MALNRKLHFFLILLLAYTVISVIFSCASIQRPQGGPRDRIPPKLLKASPANSTRNFNYKTIQLDFDEYFKLNNVFQEVTISPDMVKQPEYTYNKKSLIIKLKDTLAKNTTYVINFGKAIADVNEGNILKNFTYVFSTGPHIDSLQITGNVKDVLTQTKQKDVTVMLFPTRLDTLWGKKKPAIYTTTDTAGNFKLSNLKAGDYRIYALQEKSVNKIYDNDEELIAFNKNPIHLTRDTNNIQLTLFKQIPAKLRAIDRKVDGDGKLNFTFNKGISNPGVLLHDAKLDSQKIVDFSRRGDTALVYLKEITFDSLKVSFTENGKPLDTITLRRSKRETYKRAIALDFSAYDKLKPGTDLGIHANYPIAQTDKSRIIMLEDSTETYDFTFQKDPVNPKKFIIKNRWRQDKLYTVTFNAGTFTDVYGDRNIAITKKISLDKIENYGNIILKVTVPDSNKHYVVQLLTENGIELKSDMVTKNEILTYNNYPAAKYRIKVIYDENENGKWDTGNLKQRLQPENIWLFPKQIPLHANFDDNEDVDIPKEIKNP